MPGFRIYCSNKMEILVEELCRNLSTPVRSPLEPEIIILQSSGIERWISMAFARRTGICANIKFIFPVTFIYNVFTKLLAEIQFTENSPYDTNIMTWKIMKILPGLLKKPEFENLDNYLKVGIVSLKRFELAERISLLFDQYLLFRPDMMLSWQEGSDSGWQPDLWRELIKGCEKHHKAYLGKIFHEKLEKNPQDVRGLPQRISIFGISSLPVVQLRIFEALSNFMEVNLFFMNPCKELWATKSRLARENSLLESLGKLGKEFLSAVEMLKADKIELYEEPAASSILGFIQNDILYNDDFEKAGSTEKIPVSGEDKSIQIHSCHGHMREVEILHDQLLGMFEGDRTLAPSDILVMTPDIETYAPYVRAVFGAPEDEQRKIPFSIADQGFREESEISGTFFSILDMRFRRFGAGEVLTILESPSVKRKFGFEEADIEKIHLWIDETRIRWGMDHESKQGLGLPGFRENTWAAGIERLLLGYAMPSGDEKLFNGILAYDHIEGSEALVLGRLSEFVEELYSRVKSLDGAKTLSEWHQILLIILEGFFVSEESNQREMQIFRNVLRNLEELEELSGFNEKIEIDAVADFLRKNLETHASGSGFLTGGVTFCSMIPMRSIPFRVICLIGINNQDFPRQTRVLGFDLMAKEPEPGDRSRRDDDRYLFLESLVSAREKLYVSYVGQSIMDSSKIPPSVLLSELLDYVDQRFVVTGLKEGAKVSSIIQTEHRLQAWSPEYFKFGSKLWSFSEENCNASNILIRERKEFLPFIEKSLSEPEDDWKNIELRDLCSFYANPAKFVLERRLKIFLRETSSPVFEDTEAWSIGRLDKYGMQQRLIEMSLGGTCGIEYDFDEQYQLARAKGQIPHGTPGVNYFGAVCREARDFASRAGVVVASLGKPLEVLPFETEISGFKVRGILKDIYTNGMFMYRPAKVKGKDHLRNWLLHLLLNMRRKEGYPDTSFFAAFTDKKQYTLIKYKAIQGPSEILRDFVEYYWAGLKKPLHFFPESSFVYASKINNGKSSDEAMDSAKAKWSENFNFIESSDEYYKYSFGRNIPLDPEFEKLSLKLFIPILENFEEAKI